MLDVALEVLKKIESYGYKAYIVGGFVRDKLLKIESNDIDINTNATPKQLKEIFPDSVIPSDDYGSVIVNIKNIKFEITTFREELVYKDNRKPVEIKYVDSLYDDLLRRDFTVNAICMDKDGKIVDLLNGRVDLKKHIINTIGNCDERFKQDCLRMLRAVRFATTLKFKLPKHIRESIIANKDLLKDLSYERKKQELDKIFTSKHAIMGIKILIELELDQVLELQNLKNIKYTDSLLGIWSVLDVCDIYPFSGNELDMIKNIQAALKVDNYDAYSLYKYGLYVNVVAGSIKGLSTKKITYLYNKLPIHSKKDINIDGDDIMNILNIEPGIYIKEILHDIESKILFNKLKNDKKILMDYCINTYKDDK